MLDAVLAFVKLEDLRAALLVGGHLGQQDEAAGLLPQLFDGSSVFDNTRDHPATPPQKMTMSVFRRPSPGVDRTRREETREVIQGLNKRYPTLWDLFLRRFIPKRLQKIFRRRMDYYEMRDFGCSREYDVPFLSGAFMLCRSDLLKQLGGFDPRYFLHFEDADLCRRV